MSKIILDKRGIYDIRELMSNVDQMLVAMIGKEMGLPPKPSYYYEVIKADSGSPDGRRTRSRRRGKGVVKRDHERAESPGPSIARRVRGNEQNSQVS